MRTLIILKDQYGDIFTREATVMETLLNIGDLTTRSIFQDEQCQIIGFENLNLNKYVE